MSLKTPDTIRTLERKLYTKAKKEPVYRFLRSRGPTLEGQRKRTLTS